MFWTAWVSQILPFKLSELSRFRGIVTDAVWLRGVVELSRSKKQVDQNASKMEQKFFEMWMDQVKNACSLESASHTQSSRESEEVHSWILRKICLHKHIERESRSR